MANDTEETRGEAVIDWSILDSLKAIQKPGSPDIRARLITVFLGTSPELVTAIRDAVTSLDGSSLTKAAHSLKSSSMNMGATGLGSLCAELEALGRNNTMENSGVTLAKLESEFTAVTGAFQDLLCKIGS